MTNEELRQKYRFLKLVAQEGGRTFHALDAGGRVVMVHYLADAPETPPLMQQLDRLGVVDRRRVLDRYDVDGAPVVVTEFIQGFTTFVAWVQARAPGAPASSGSPAGPGAPRGAKAGEFTNLFGPGGSPTVAATKDTDDTEPLPAIAPPQVAPAPDGLTQLLDPGALPQAAPRAADPGRGTQPLRAVVGTRAATPPAAPPSSPAGMTQFFGAPEAAPPPREAIGPNPVPPSPPSATSPAPPGGMTQLFGAPEASERKAVDRSVEPPVRGPAPPAKSTPATPGGMTQLFGLEEGPPASRPAASAVPPPPAPTPAPAPPSSPKPTVHWREAPPEGPKTPPVVHLKTESPNPSSAPAGPLLHRVPAPPAPPPPAGPKPAGEFTRLFGGGDATDASVPPSPPRTGPRVPSPGGPPPNLGPPVSPATPSAGPGTPGPRPPGEFTQLFQSQPKAGPPPLTAPPSPSDRDYRAALSGPPGGSSAGPGFGPPAPPSAPPAKQAGEFTQLMAGGMLPSPATPVPSLPPRPGTPGPPAARPAGPGDFTRIVSAPPPSAAPTPVPAAPRPAPPPQVRAPAPGSQAAAAPRSGPSSRVVLVLALGVLGLTAVALILYVVLRAKS